MSPPGEADFGGDDVLGRLRVAIRGTVPDTAAEGGDIDHLRVVWVRYHAVTPLEVVAPYPLPGDAAVERAPCGILETAGVERLGVVRVNGNVIDVLIAVQHVLPRTTAIRGEPDAAVDGAVRRHAAPRSKIQAIRVRGIDSQAVRTVHLLGKRDAFPVLRTVAGAVDGAVAWVAVGTIFGSPRDDRVERSILRPGQTPRQRVLAGDTIVLDHPRLAAVSGLHYAAAHGGDVEGTGLGRTLGLENDMRGGGGRERFARHPPRAATVVAHSDAAAIGLRVQASPHLGTRQVVDARHDCPGAPFHLGIELHPKGIAGPGARCRPGYALPTDATIFAGEQADIGVGDKNVLRVERVEVNTVARGNVEAGIRPGVAGNQFGVNAVPVLAAVRGAHGEAHIGAVADVGVVGRHANVGEAPAPARTEAPGEPAIVDVGRLGLRGLIQNQFPGAPVSVVLATPKGPPRTR